MSLRVSEADRAACLRSWPRHPRPDPFLDHCALEFRAAELLTDRSGKRCHRTTVAKIIDGIPGMHRTSICNRLCYKLCHRLCYKLQGRKGHMNMDGEYIWNCYWRVAGRNAETFCKTTVSNAAAT
jgi:hypothetical protein